MSGYKVHPRTNAWAPYGYHWTWNALLADWILTEAPTEYRAEFPEENPK